MKIWRVVCPFLCGVAVASSLASDRYTTFFIPKWANDAWREVSKPALDGQDAECKGPIATSTKPLSLSDWGEIKELKVKDAGNLILQYGQPLCQTATGSYRWLVDQSNNLTIDIRVDKNGIHPTLTRNSASSLQPRPAIQNSAGKKAK